MSDTTLVVDVGTSSVRAAVVRSDGSFAGSHDRELLPESPADGLVQFDAVQLAETCLDLARAALAADGPVDAVGISDQRGSTVVCTVTGHGLKDPEWAISTAPAPVTIAADPTVAARELDLA